MKIKTALYAWQEKAVKKLTPIRVGALYMEMGTGKTRTTLEMIQTRLEKGKIEHVLWLCPCSVRENLRIDIQKHADGALSSIAIYGIESLSGSLRLYEKLMDYVKAKPTMLVVDESNLVKNFKTIRTQRIISLASECKYRLILNGTPVTKTEVDFFAQWYVLDWRILGYRSFYSFARNHIEYDPNVRGKIRRTLDIDTLIEKIAPYSYQVTKDECFKLQGKNYSKVYYDLDGKQMEHYRTVTDIMLEWLDEQRPATVYRMFTVAQDVISGLYVDVSKKHIKTRLMFDRPEDNPRITALLELIEEIEGQAIIFAKYTHEIKAISEVLPNTISFYGGLSQSQRQANLDCFRSGKVRFLVANKSCAGYGLNLQFCHNVIFYSNDWDWGTRVQSEDRVYRLGQEHEVNIYDIIADRTLDVRIMRCLDRKEGLAMSIKRELKSAKDVSVVHGDFRKWLRGEISENDVKTILDTKRI